MYGFIVFYYVIYLLTPENNSSLLYYFASIKHVGEKELLSLTNPTEILRFIFILFRICV